ncbi:hypothetical protein AH02_49 [Pseudomonas phage AH02]|nr:hypothetical protein AH02_49 [Pseudomonas phage AH02]
MKDRFVFLGLYVASLVFVVCLVFLVMVLAGV